MTRTPQTLSQMPRHDFSDIAPIMSNESLREIAAYTGTRTGRLWERAVARRELARRDREVIFGRNEEG